MSTRISVVGGLQGAGPGGLTGCACYALVVALLMSSVSSAQQQPAQSPTFRSSTLLIVQTVTVKDKNGKPIEGLTAKDFVVTEDGVAQDVAFVEYQKLDAPPLGAISLETGATAAAGSPVSTAPPIASLTQVGDTLAAVPLPGDTRYRGKRLIVLYVDLSGLSMFDEGRVFDGARKYLRASMTAADMISVFSYDSGRVRMKQDFTDDRVQLLKVINDLEQAQLDAEQGIVAIEDFRTAFGEDEASFNMFASDRKLSALQTTVSNLGPLPEMKTLIYFGTLNIDVNNMAQVRATVNAAVRSNVTINPVDVRGLTATAPMGNASQASRGGVGMFSGTIAQQGLRRALASQDSYYALAKDTGGKAFFNNNDLSLGIEQAAQAVTGYYMLGYYTKNQLKDGKFRRVKVSLTGALAADAEIAHRAGYYGAKEWAKFNDFDKDRQLEEAMRLEDPITDIPMAIEVNYFQISSAEYFVPVSVRMPGSELARPRPSGSTKADIDILAEIKDEYGVTMRNSRDRLEFKLDSATAADVARKPIQYETGFTVLPGNYIIKVLARDATTGRIGTFMHPFVVPNLEKEKSRLPISTVVFSTQRVPTADALYTVKQKIDVATSNPLVENGIKLVPSVTRTFSAQQPLFIYLQAYERDLSSPTATAEQGPRPLVAFVTFFENETKVFESEPLAADTWDPKTKAVAIRMGIRAGKLKPGSYTCQVTVLDPAGNKAAYWRGAVEIVR
jgi:VWFA-related protein